jgi:nucleoside-diphosphate-sugar epimerase
MKKALVTGATGFLGWHACMALQSRGWTVTGLGRNLAAGAKLEAQGVLFVHGDLRDEGAVSRACSKQDAVFHCGALSSPWGRYREFHDINVDGTRHVVQGCQRHDVKRLIHISTPSIYFDHTRDRLNVAENALLPAKQANAYAATKLLAEEVVFDSLKNGQEGLILRPRAIFGPLDSALLPRLMRANETSGVPLFRRGDVWLDLTYVDNVVEAMLLGWEAPSEALGQAYNITNGEPSRLGDVLAELFGMLGVRLNTREIPYPVAFGAAALMEWSHRLLPFLGEPKLTRYSVGVLARSQTLDITKARQQLGYAPRISLHEGLKRFAEWWSAGGQ